MTSFVVAKFGGTSVADYDAMNRSADVVLADPNTRLVVLSASAGVTNLLVYAFGGDPATASLSSAAGGLLLPVVRDVTMTVNMPISTP